MTWSPTGDHLASASLDGTVKVWDAVTEQEALTLPDQGEGVAWTTDGKRLALTTRGTVTVRDAATGLEALVFCADGEEREVPRLESGRQLVSNGGYRRESPRVGRRHGSEGLLTAFDASRSPGRLLDRLESRRYRPWH